jgi:hypothetical protein
MLQVAHRRKWAVASIIAAAAVGGFTAAQSQAKLVIDVTALNIVDGSGPGTISADGKTVTGVGVGTKINYRVTGQIVFAGDTDTDTDFDGFPDQDDLIQSVEGTLKSSGAGTIKVDMTHAVNTAGTSKFNATGSQQGTPFDADGDGDLDIGPLNPLNGQTQNGAQNINYRSNGATGIDIASNLYNLNLASPNPALTGPSTFTVTDASGAPTQINWITSAVFGVGGQPQWTENGVVKNQVNGDTIEIGSPVTISAVPEPASLGLLGLGALGLLRRRRA